MQNINSIITKSIKLTFLTLLVALAGWQASNANSFAAPQAAPTQTAPPKSAANAKRILASIGPRDFNKVKDARLRDAMQRTHTSLQAVADNTSTAREATLVATFKQNLNNLKAVGKKAIPFAEKCNYEYDNCMESCKAGLCDICAGKE